jgi:Ni,Fe-hydrogenase III large subunit
MIAAALIRASGTLTPSHPWPRRVLTQDAWRLVLAALPASESVELLAMWADQQHVHALFHDLAVPEILPVSVPVTDGAYPSLSPMRPAAAWFERMIHDLWGHVAADGLDQRPWLDHGAWDHHQPLSPRPPPVDRPPQPPEFLPVEGEDLHVVPVGPIHAGIIEAGHFRFTCAGETVVRLEARRGYKHRGILTLLRGKSPRAAARFAARLSGDSTVAHSIAFARAAEAACATEAPPRAHTLRGVMAELERIANHCNDIGAICNDCGFALPLARFGWHREALLRACHAAFGHRLMMDVVIPGGIAPDLAPSGVPELVAALDRLEDELPQLGRILDDRAGLADRLIGTGVVTHALATLLAPGGVIGRAAGRPEDARKAPGYPPYAGLPFATHVRPQGDVNARLRLRLDEIGTSLLLVRTLLERLPEGPLTVPLPAASAEGFGVAEGFRGICWAWLRLDTGSITAGFLCDPSWRQWPLLEAATLGNIIADFPLINKSFNCSYAGVDL